MKRTLIITAMLIMSSIASGEEPKVFTNDDLDGYKQTGGSNNTSEIGTMSKSYRHENSDVSAYGSDRRNYGTAGASYNRDESSTSYTKKITDQDLRILEADEYTKKKEAELRQLELERKRQTEEVREAERRDKMRIERDQERNRQDNESLRYRFR